MSEFDKFLRWEQEDQDKIKVKRIYIDIAGDIVAGLLLSQIIYWHLPSKKGTSRLQVYKDGQLWLAKGRDDWWDECRITSRQFDRAITMLTSKGIVRKELFRFAGSPTVHVRLVPEKLMEYKNAILQKREEEEGQREIHFTESVKSNSPNGEIQLDESVKTLTEITTEITTETTTREEPSAPYEKIKDLYNETCTSLSKVRLVTENRKATIKARWRQHGHDLTIFEELFTKAEASYFLCGGNDRGWKANFDWLLNEANMAKTLEGRYDDDAENLPGMHIWDNLIRANPEEEKANPVDSKRQQEMRQHVNQLRRDLAEKLGG